MPWQNTPADRRQSNATYGPAWRRARDAQLKAHPNCQLRIEGVCTGRATQVDHIYGTEADPGHQHLRSVCAPCHRKRTATEQGLGYRQPKTEPMDPQPKPATTW